MEITTELKNNSKNGNVSCNASFYLDTLASTLRKYFFQTTETSKQGSRKIECYYKNVDVLKFIRVAGDSPIKELGKLLCAPLAICKSMLFVKSMRYW